MTETTATVPVLLTEVEAAQLLKRQVKTLVNWRWQRVGPPYVKVGGAVRYNAVELGEWIVRQSVDGTKRIATSKSAGDDRRGPAPREGGSCEDIR